MTAAPARTPLGDALGVDRALILHVDDLGATLGANLAFLALAERGLVTCGSVMVPGEFAAVSAQHAPWRFAEYALLRDGAVAALCAQFGVEVRGCRDVQRLWVGEGGARGA